jgi:Homeodomain-like domain
MAHLAPSPITCHSLGCREPGCVEAANANSRRYRAERKARVRAAGTPPRNHGAYGYATHGCRCETCVDAFRRSVRPRRERVWGTEPPVHGHTGYTDYGCRCATCSRAKAAYFARYTARRDAELPAARRGAEWTGPDLEIAMRDDLSITEIARMLGRSYSTVVRMRSRIRHGDARLRRLAGLVDED